MSARVVSDVEATGQLVARKRSRDAADAARLTHEADVLAAARHPGVVEVVRCEHDDTGAALVTAFIGTHSLDTIGPLSIERAAGIVAALAETAADLHDLGFVHGRIDPSHVLIGPGGRPVLCGFAGGGRIGSTPPPGPAAALGFEDPATTDEAVLTTERDVYGLGCLLRALVIDTNSDLEPIPDRRFNARLRAPWSGYQRRALLTLADRATDEAPLRRPPARRVAADIHDTIPGAHLGDDPFAGLRSTVEPRPQSRRARQMTMAAIGLALALVLVGFAGLRDEGPVAAQSDPIVASSSAPPTTAPSEPLRTTVVGPDGIITVGSRRYTGAAPGDRFAVGDWNCDGSQTIALLRSATGALLLFDTLTTQGADVPAERRFALEASELRTRATSDGCPTLIAVAIDGIETEVWG